MCRASESANFRGCFGGLHGRSTVEQEWTDWSAEGTRLDRSAENDRPTSVGGPPDQKFFDHRLRFILITSLSSLY